MVSAAEQKVKEIFENNPVAVFSKSYCPYCTQAKKLLKDSGASAYVVELDEIDDGSDMQAALANINGQRTVPNIYIGGEHIGGNSDLQAKKGQLKTLLKDAGAI